MMNPLQPREGMPMRPPVRFGIGGLGGISRPPLRSERAAPIPHPMNPQPGAQAGTLSGSMLRRPTLPTF